MGGLSSETDVTSNVPGRHQQGGWAQMRYQRRVKDHMDRHHKEVAEYLAAYSQVQPQAFIILSGQDEIIANLRQFLPTQVQQQVIDVTTNDVKRITIRLNDKMVDLNKAITVTSNDQTLYQGRPQLRIGTLAETTACGDPSLVFRAEISRDLPGN